MWLLPKGQFCEETKVLSGPVGDVSLEPRVGDLLVEFLRHPGEVLSHEQLLASVWQGRVVSDEAVRRAVSNLRRALKEVGYGKPVRTLHKKGYVCELQGEVQVAPADAGLTRRQRFSRPRASWQLLYHVCVIGLLLSLGVGSITLLWGHFSPAPGARGEVRPAIELPITIAVLPFANFVEDDQARLFADGMAEELVGLLARIHLFRVTSRSSSDQYRERAVDVREVGRDLGVHYLIEGSVRREAGSIRVNAALIDTRNGFQVWAGGFRHDELEGLLGVQTDIAKEVARALQVVLVDDERQRSSPSPMYLEARREYRQGLTLTESWHSDDLRQAISHLQRAISIDPGLAEAYVALADALSQLASDPARVSEVWDTVQTLTDKALELAPDMGAAYASRAVPLMDIDLDAAEADLRRGIRLSPSYSPAYARLAEMLFFRRGDYESAQTMIDQSISLDPLRPRNLHMKAYFERFQCRFEQAARLEEQALTLEPRFRSALAGLGAISAYRGELALSVDYFEQALALDPSGDWIRSSLIVAYLNLGDEDAARRLNDPPLLKPTLLLQAYRGEEAALAETLYATEVSQLEVLTPAELTHFALRAALATGEFQRSQELLDTVYADWSAVTAFRSDDRSVLSDRLPAYLNMLLLRLNTPGSDAQRVELAGVRRALLELEAGGPGCLYGRVEEALALADMALGDPGAAVLRLLSAVREHRVLRSAWWMLRNNPVYAGLQQEPGFTAIVEEGAAVAQLQRTLGDKDASSETVLREPGGAALESY